MDIALYFPVLYEKGRVMRDPIVLTNSAVNRVKSILEEDGLENAKLRVYVTGGGCSGFQYGFSFSEKIADEDTVISRGGMSLIVDPVSLQYLFGAEIDFEEGLEGARFIIKNPNVGATCGCGHSFTIGDKR